MIKVWDLFVRLSHWLIVLLVISAWFSAHYGDTEFKWHTFNGYAVFVLVLSRVIWGVVGSTTAKFTHFLTLPHTAFLYLINLFKGKAPEYLGHNPAGGWMVVIVLLVLLAQATTGMFSSDDIVVEGPFAYYVSGHTVESMTGWHHFLFDALMILVALHLLAVLYHQIFKKEKLIQAMFHGKKMLSTKNKIALAFQSFYIALITLGLITAIFWFILNTYS